MEKAITTTRWGLIGASTIAKEWADGAIRETGGEVVCVMSSDAARAERYASENGFRGTPLRLDQLLADRREAVYISTRPRLHHDQTVAAARAANTCSAKAARPVASEARGMVRPCDAGVG